MPLALKHANKRSPHKGLTACLLGPSPRPKRGPFPCRPVCGCMPRERLSYIATLFACFTPPPDSPERMPFDAEGEDWDASQLANPPLEGFLLKKGAKGITLGWKRRWFVLSNQRIYYYKTSDAVLGTEQGFIDLCGAYQLEEGEELGHFRIRTPQRLWFLAAEAEEECRFWVQGLTSYKKRQHRSVANLNAIDRLRSSASSRTAASDDPYQQGVNSLNFVFDSSSFFINNESVHYDERFSWNNLQSTYYNKVSFLKKCYNSLTANCSKKIAHRNGQIHCL